jgi:hypothetical protein
MNEQVLAQLCALGRFLGKELQAVQMLSNFLRPVPGEWYFTVNCRNCGSPVRFFPDETKGNIEIKAQKTVNVHCPHCLTSGSYHTSEMTSTQEPEANDDAS